MSRMRNYLTAELESRVQRNGIVVWMDPHGEYADVAESVVPEGVEFGQLDGSWYALRRSLEDQLVCSDPRLVVYVDAEVQGESPLEELQAAGREYRIRLSTLVKKSLAGELTDQKLAEIGEAAATISEAEALIEGGAAGGPSQLVKKAGVSEPIELVLTLITQHEDDLEADEQLRDELDAFLKSYFGIVRAGDPATLCDSVARHLVMVELADAIDALPGSLAVALPEASAAQRTRAGKVLRRWRHDETFRDSYLKAMGRASADLDLSGQLVWDDGITGLDTVPAYEDVALERFLALVQDGEFSSAEELVRARLDCFWAGVSDETRRWRELWSVAYSVAQLRRFLEDVPRPRSVESTLRHYADSTWNCDRAHRRLELALISFVERDQLEQVIQEARRAYDEWLDRYLRDFTACLEAEGLATGDLLRQARVHSEVVAPASQQGTVAYFLVDALRYELGSDLRDRIARVFPTSDVELTPAVALLPSITSIGMANLCPGADSGLRVELASDNRLRVSIDGQDVMTPADRVTRLRAAHGSAVDLRLDEIFRSTDQELEEILSDAALVLVRSQEIDEVGETGKISASLDMFDLLMDHLGKAVARLSQHGIRYFVITADHGFLALTRNLGGHMTIPKPGGEGVVHRRAFIGRGGASGESLVRIPMSKIGLPGDLDVVVPRGLALIAAGGARGFFHGGASPQELLVPVLAFELAEARGRAEIVLQVSLASKITTHVFLGKLQMREDLFSEPMDVRVVPVPIAAETGEEVGVLVTTDADEEAEGLVRLEPGASAAVGFRLTKSLSKGDKVVLQVFDARTDRLLATSSPAIVARELEVDNELA